MKKISSQVHFVTDLFIIISLLVIMLRFAFEGYLLMLFTFLHLGIIACDENCLPPIRILSDIVPETFSQFAINIFDLLGLHILTAQIIGQLMLIGDIFICGLMIIKFFGAILKRFLLMFVSLMLSIFALQSINII